MWKIILLLLFYGNMLHGLTLSLDNYRDRKFDFSWEVLPGTYTFKLYFATFPFTGTPAELMRAEISTTTISTSIFRTSISLDITYNQSFSTAQAVLYEVISSTLSNVVFQVIQIRTIYHDVDGDDDYEETRDTDNNILNGYETYIDDDFSSKSYKRITVGSKKWFLIDTTLDNRPNVLWLPDTLQTYPLIRKNVDRDNSLEYEVAGGFIHPILNGRVFYDVDTDSFVRFCIIKGSVKDNQGNSVNATLEIWSESNQITSVDVTGNFEIYVDTITYEQNYKIIARKARYVSAEKTEYLMHGAVHLLGDFILYAAVTEQNKLKIFPNPAKDKITFAIDVPSQTTIKTDILDLSGSFIERIINEVVPAGFYEYSFFLNLPPGYYYFVSFIGNNKTVTKIKVIK